MIPLLQNTVRYTSDVPITINYNMQEVQKRENVQCTCVQNKGSAIPTPPKLATKSDFYACELKML